MNLWSIVQKTDLGEVAEGRGDILVNYFSRKKKECQEFNIILFPWTDIPRIVFSLVTILGTVYMSASEKKKKR